MPEQRVLHFAALCAFAIWLGGLTFYGAVVIPIGHDVLGSHREVGFITRQVTLYLNGVGVIALVLGWIVRHGMPRVRITTWLLVILSLLMVALLVLHPILDAHLDVAAHSIDAPDTFYEWHRAYLLVTMVQWLAGAALAWHVTRQWR